MECKMPTPTQRQLLPAPSTHPFPGAHQTQLEQFCFVFLLSWTVFSLSFHPFSLLFSPALSMVCSTALCLLPKSLGPWLILLLFLVCGVFFGSLSPERHWAAKGAQRPQVNPPSTGISREMLEGRQGDLPGPHGPGICFSSFHPCWGVRGQVKGVAQLPCLRPWNQMLAEQPGIPGWSPGTRCPLRPSPCPRDPWEWRLQASPGHSHGDISKTPQNSQAPEGQYQGCLWSPPSKQQGGWNG